MSVDPDDFIIAKKRKLYKFALFLNASNCYEYDDWSMQSADIVEKGAGTGVFGVALASAYPALSIIALDVKADRLQVGANNAIERGLTNINFLRVRAGLLSEVIRSSSVSIVWVTFPDPYPKPRSAKHRLTHPHFLREYAALLAPEGELRFKTDSRELFLWSLEKLIAEKWTITELSFDLHRSRLSDEYKIQTVYETYYRSLGRPIHFVSARRPN